MTHTLPLANQRSLVLHRPLVMGILNVTPDSFSDGGRYTSPAAALARALDMLDEGADILDIGGESTRPGAARVPADVEIQRVVPAVSAIRQSRPQAIISVDTSKAAVAQAALDAGADFINDVTALQDPEMAHVIREAGCAVVLMRNRDTGSDVVPQTIRQLTDLRDNAMAAGIPEDAILLDPGLGFGELPGADAGANLELVKALPRLAELGSPLLVGASRKRFIGAVTGEADAERRLGGSLAVAVASVMAGADIVRVHDVRDTVQAVRVAAALR